MTRAVIYTRISPSPDSDESKSCERQHDRCLAYCMRLGYDRVGIAYHEDNGVSGGDLCRPELSKAIDALQSGDILVVDRPDRLARDMLVFLTLQHQVASRGARIEFADGSPPDTTPEGRLFQGMLALWAAYERDRIRLWTKAGLARKRAKGVHLGRCPIGYKRGRGGKLVEHPGEQLAIAYIEARATTGISEVESAARMNAHFGPIRGNPWTPRLVRRILERKENTQ